jgi:hypothetical protein
MIGRRKPLPRAAQSGAQRQNLIVEVYDRSNSFATYRFDNHAETVPTTTMANASSIQF